MQEQQLCKLLLLAAKASFYTGNGRLMFLSLNTH